MTESKFRLLKKFTNYSKNILNKQKLNQVFGKVYIFDVKEYKQFYEWTIDHSLYIVPIDKERRIADAIYQKVLNFQKEVYENPIKSVSDCQKIFNLTYTYKDQYFDETKMHWYVLRGCNDAKLVPTIDVANAVFAETEKQNKKIGYVPCEYDFVNDKYYKKTYHFEEQKFVQEKTKDKIFEDYNQNNEYLSIEYYQNLDDLITDYPEIKNIDITTIVPLDKYGDVPLLDKTEVLQYTQTLQKVVNDKILERTKNL